MEVRIGTITTKGPRSPIFISYLLLCWGLTGSFLDKSLRNFYASISHSVRTFITLGLYQISQLSLLATQAVSGGRSGCSGHKAAIYFSCHTTRWPGWEGLGSNPQTPSQAAPEKPLSIPKPPFCTRSSQGSQPTSAWPLSTAGVPSFCRGPLGHGQRLRDIGITPHHSHHHVPAVKLLMLGVWRSRRLG